MATISLRSYLEQIRSAVEEGYLDEALVHCRRILEQYPQHLETYRLFGATLLKSREHEDAADVFERLLSAEPGDAVAHSGLAKAYAAMGRLPEAGLHGQLAFEIQPYAPASGTYQVPAGWNSEVESQHYGLTRAALARIHVRGGLYPQAIAYLSSAASSPTARPDLRALLAEALWRDGRRLEAVEVSRELLRRLPNCVIANAILAESLLASDQVGEAHVHLSRVQSALLLEQEDLLDDSLPAIAFNTRGAFPLDEMVTVQALELKHAPARRSEELESSWFTRMGINSDEQPVELGTLFSDEPDWLPAFEIAGTAVGSGLYSPAVAQFEQMTDDLGVQSAMSDEPAGDETSPGDGRADVGLAVVAGLSAAALHEAMAAERRPEEVAEEPNMSGNELSADTNAMQEPDEHEATLAWLETLAARQGVSMDELSASGEPSLPEEAAEPFPDWLTRDLSESPAGAEGAQPPGSAQGQEDDIPDWLRDSVDAPAAAAVAVVPTESDSLDDLSWLDQIAAGAGEAIDEPPTLSWQKSGYGGADDDEALSWLDAIIEPSPAATAAGLAVAATARSEETASEEVAGVWSGEESTSLPDSAPLAPMEPYQESDEDDALATEARFEPAIPEREEAEAAVMASLDDVPEDLEAAQLILGTALVGERATGEVARDQKAEVVMQPAAELAADVPEDPADVLNWLEKLAMLQIAERAIPAPTEPIQVVEEPVTPAVPLEVVAAAAAAESRASYEVPIVAEAEVEIDSVENLIASIPDDPDAAMAWLDQLAAQQEAVLAEAPDAAEQVDEPAALDEAQESAAGKAALTAMAMRALAESAGEEEEVWPVDVEQEVAGAMPDWLELEPAQGSDAPPVDLPTAWEAEQAEFVAWLAGEEAEQLSEPDAVSEESSPEADFETLEAASAPDLADLIAGYERDLAQGDNPEGVLQALLALVGDSPEPDIRTARLLGDAYAQTGDYARALDSYSSALDLL